MKTSNGRLRSKSVSASKAEPQNKIVRSISGNGTQSSTSSSSSGAKNLSDSMWKNHNINNSNNKTSSPNPKKVSLETMGDELIIDEDFDAATTAKNNFFCDNGVVITERETFHRDTAPKFKKSRENRGLITCDTAALTTSVELKKHCRPKESAGEIKFSVSGSNSEDELLDDEHQSENSSTASSTVSTGPSTPSISSSSTSSSNQQPIESIEDVLLRWKEHNNTPMEVSWIEEGEPSESCV
jgi:hypothetical protein